MTALLGTNVAAKLVPFDSADTFPTHDAFYGLGGWREVADITARNAIPAARLDNGSIIFVQSESRAYLWNGATFTPYKMTAIGVFWPNSPAASQFMLNLPLTVSLTFPASLTGSKFLCRVNPTADTTFNFLKNGSSIGSVKFAASTGAVTVTFASQVIFAVGDVFAIQAPVTPDSTCADIAFDFLTTP